MFSISAYRTPSRKDLRSFAWILAGGFFVIAIAPKVFRHEGVRSWALVLSALFVLTGVLTPGVLRPIHRVWIAFGNILGWINSRIILGLLFYIVVTPIRFLLALGRVDPMNRQFNSQADSYRVVRKTRDVSHMKHQF